MGQDEVLAFLFYKRVIKNDDSFFSAEEITKACVDANCQNTRHTIHKLDALHFLERRTVTIKKRRRRFEYRLDLLYERQVELMLEFQKLRGRDYVEQWTPRTSNTNGAKLRKDSAGVIAMEHNKCTVACKQRTCADY
jgi:hypothetical protein